MLTKREYLDERLPQVELEFINNKIWYVIITYSPNENAFKEEQDILFNNLQRMLDTRVNNKIIICDLNGGESKMIKYEQIDIWKKKENT